jgi:hypothetical protein
VERIFARPGLRRRPGSDYEQLPETEEARICRPMSRLRPRSPMAKKTSHHVFLVASSEEAEQRIRDHYLTR